MERFDYYIKGMNGRVTQIIFRRLENINMFAIKDMLEKEQDYPTMRSVRAYNRKD